VSVSASVTLGEVADLLVGNAFKSDGFLAENEDGIPILRGENVGQASLKWVGKTKRWREEDLPELARYELQLGDVILAMDRPIVGDGLKYAWITENDLPCLLVQRVCRIRGKAEKALIDYLRYVIGSPAFTEHIHRITTGANIPHISGKDISAFSFPLPSLAEQVKIVEALAPYDELVITYEKQIALLEEAARLIYTEWFIRLRFPGHHQIPNNTGIPQGWKHLHFPDVADLVGGGTPSTDRADYWDGDILWVTPTDITRNDCLALLDTQRKITEQGLESSNARLFPPRSILMTSRASIGYFALCDGPACTNQGFICLVPQAEEARYFLLFNLMSRKEEIESLATGATFKEISKKTFQTVPLLMPSKEVLQAFNDAVTPMIDQIFTLKRQLVVLRQARALLLPRLISGQLRL